MTALRNKLCMDCEITVRALVTDNATLLTMAAEKELKFATNKNNYVPPITISQVYPQKYFIPGLKYYSTVRIAKLSSFNLENLLNFALHFPHTQDQSSSIYILDSDRKKTEHCGTGKKIRKPS